MRPIEKALTRIMVAGFAALTALPPSSSFAQDQDVTKVEGVEVTSTFVPVPKVGDGAPMFSNGELSQVARTARRDNNFYASEASVLQACYVEAFMTGAPDERLKGYEEAHEASQRLAAVAEEAAHISSEAIDVRRRAKAGTATQAEVEKAELERQHAVLRVLAAQNAVTEGKAKAIDAQQLSSQRIPVDQWPGILRAQAAAREAANGVWSPIPPQFADLAIQNVKAFSRDDDKGGAFLYVVGEIRNTRTKRISVPPIAVSAIDDAGFALVTETSTAKGRIEPGGILPFRVELRPNPPRSSTVAVTFGDPQRPGWLLPAAADVVCSPPAPEELDPARRGSVKRNFLIRGGR